MNRHAEKLRESTTEEESSLIDRVLGGVVSAIHYCPNCGKVEAVDEPRP